MLKMSPQSKIESQTCDNERNEDRKGYVHDARAQNFIISLIKATTFRKVKNNMNLPEVQ